MHRVFSNQNADVSSSWPAVDMAESQSPKHKKQKHASYEEIKENESRTKSKVINQSDEENGNDHDGEATVSYYDIYGPQVLTLVPMFLHLVIFKKIGWGFRIFI